MEIPFLEEYDGKDTEALLALEGTYRTDSLVLAFEAGLVNKKTLSQEERVVLAVEAMEREVNHDGFLGLFINSYREHVPNLVSSLLLIGCPKTAELVRQAIEALGIRGPVSAKAIGHAASAADDALADRLNELDSIYYRGEEEPIAEKLFEYIKKNRAHIRVAP